MIFSKQGNYNFKGFEIACPTNERWVFSMLDFTWKVFSQTGNIDTYLLFKELEKENLEIPEGKDEELNEVDFPIM